MAVKDDPLTVYAAELIREWMRERTLIELSELSGVTSTHLSNIRDLTKGAGMKTLKGLCVAFNVTLEEFENRARGGETLAIPMIPKNLSDTITFARAVGISEDAITAARGLAIRDGDKHPEQWVMWLKLWDADHVKGDHSKKK